MELKKELLKDGNIVHIDMQGAIITGLVCQDVYMATSKGCMLLKDYNDLLEDTLIEGNKIIKVFSYKDSRIECIWDREKDFVEWDKVAVDTCIYVSIDGKEWCPRYFAKYENGKVYTFKNGRTSFSVENWGTTSWNYAKLA